MNQNTKRILIVASDYGLIRTVRDALTHQILTLQIGYSHIDGLYALENGDFDAVVVDALLANHRDGVSTLVKLSQLNHAIPIVGLANDPALMDDKGLPPNVSVVVPSDSMIRQTVMLVLGVEVAAPPPVLPEKKPNTKTLAESAPPTSPAPLPVLDEMPDVTSNSADKLQTLFALSKSLTEVLDLGEVLNRVVEAARRLT
ncbi:MAG: hypothetical protein ABI970_24690, partial [Chloroflexota bacterium]